MSTLTIELPDELGDCEVIASFLAYPRGATIDPNTGEPKLSLGIPVEDKYKALPITDRTGETFHVVVIGRVAQELPDFDFQGGG